MTQEEKELLLKDLCARLPYGVIVHFHDIDVDDYERQLIGEDIDFIKLDRRFCKPYLRSMSSMTNNEIETYRIIIKSLLEKSVTDNIATLYNFLNSKHLDYNALIPRGLAIAVTEENNPYK